MSGDRDRRIPREIVLVTTPVIGLVGALAAWQAAHVAGRRVCGMAYGVPERITTNGLGFLWTVLGTILMVGAGSFLAFGRGRAPLIVGLVLLGLFVLGAVALPLLAVSSCEGDPGRPAVRSLTSVSLRLRVDPL